MKIRLILTCIIFHLSSQLYCQSLTSGLVGYWPFNGNSNDSTLNLNHGTVINGASYLKDRFNNEKHAIQFNKSLSQYIRVNNSSSLQISSAITATFWIKRNSLSGQDQVLNKGGDWPSGTCNYGLVFSDWTLCFIYNGGYYIISSPGVPQDYNWHQYAVTAVNGTTDVHFFVDGAEIPSQFGGMGNATVDLFSLSTSDLYIGGVNYFSNNAMDDLMLFNRVLTANEIKSLYSGLVAYWPFNGNANDQSGNSNDGINHNGIYSKDRFGNDNSSMLFSGNDSYVEGKNPGNNLPVGNSQRTISAWIKEKSFHPWGNNIFHYGLDQAAPTNFHLYTTDVIRFGNGYDYGVVAGITPIADDTWHFVAGVYEGGTGHIAKIFVDGKLDATGSLSTEPNTTLGSNWKIGRFMTGSNNFDGEIDELKVFNRALSETEIESLYKEDLTTGLEEKLFINIKTYPNPTKGDLNIDMGSIFKNVHIKIFDLSGRLIIEKEYNDKQQFIVNLHEPSGMYFLTIIYDNRKTVLKIIKE